MIADYEDDAHFCLKCHMTIIGLENYINHRKTSCSKSITVVEIPKSPLPSQLLPPDESFTLKADDFFSSLELQSSSKKAAIPSTSGKTFSGILTRSKTSAVIHASNSSKDEPQPSKSGKNAWIGGHQLKELGTGDNQTKLLKAVDNLSRSASLKKEQLAELAPGIQVYDSDEDTDEFDYDDDEFEDDEDAPPRSFTGGKWKPSSPVPEWNEPPPLNFTGGKWKPTKAQRYLSPPQNHTKGKWKPESPIPGGKVNFDVPTPSFTGSKWTPSKAREYNLKPVPKIDKICYDNEFSTLGNLKGKVKSIVEDEFPPPGHTKGKWKPPTEEYPPPGLTKGKWKPPDNEFPPPVHTKGKWKPGVDEFPPPTHTKGKWKPAVEEFPPPTHTKDKWKPTAEEFPPPTHTKGKWKPTAEEFPPPTHTKGKWKPAAEEFPPPTHTKGKWKPTVEEFPPPTHTKGKWKPAVDEFPPPTHTKGKWKPTVEEFPPPTHTKGKWKPTVEEFPPATHTKVKWNSLTEEEFPPPGHTKGEEFLPPGLVKVKPKLSINEPPTVHSKDKWKPATEEFSPPGHTKGKWKPPTEEFSPNKDSFKPPAVPADTNRKNKPKVKVIKRDAIESDAVTRKSNMQYWCSPCNRRLASKIVYERHLKSELHHKRTEHNDEFDDSLNLNTIHNKESKTTIHKPVEYWSKNTLPENNTDTMKNTIRTTKRIRRNKYVKCEVCRSRVTVQMMGKHLISHYHCRKGDIKRPDAQKMILDNIHDIVLQSPYQCGACKFYCNTQNNFLEHWNTQEHVAKILNAPGVIWCAYCKFKCIDNSSMYMHLISNEHDEVNSAINRSVPIIIKKMNLPTCFICNEEFILNIQLIKHCQRTNHAYLGNHSALQNRQNCRVCKKTFKSFIALQRHLTNVHKLIVYFCSICSLVFDNSADVQRHRRTQEHKNTVSIKTNPPCEKKCDFCPSKFDNFLLLKEHLKSSHPEHSQSCPHCGKKFTISQEVTVHIRSKACVYLQEPNKPNTCDRCPFSSDSVSELLFHKALHQEPIITTSEELDGVPKKKVVHHYKCPLCGKIFGKPSLRFHLRNHTNEKLFECHICHTKFARKSNWKLHVKNHEMKLCGQKPVVYSKEAIEKGYLCAICGKNFNRSSILQKHMFTHTGKKFKCPEPGCIYVGRTGSEIKSHRKTHSDEKNYACAQCDYRGKSQQQLKRHATIHEELKKYSCSHCTFTTRLSSHLRRHERLHTGAKPYGCPHCEYRCNNLENLRKHVLSTNKHPGKCIYECKFCEDDQFQSNFAKDFKVHLISEHSDVFESRTDAASYISGIYDSGDDNVNSRCDIVTKIRCNSPPLVLDEPCAGGSGIITASEGNAFENNDNKDELFPMYIIDKDVCVDKNTWSMVASFDVEESGALVSFNEAGETFFQEHFQ